MKKILLRADGNNQIGFGHIFRLIAMYEMLSEHYECTFLSLESGFTQALTDRKIPLELIPSTENELEYIFDNFAADKNLLVVDGYQFDKTYFSSLKEHGYSSVFVDDMYQHEFPVDVIINHSPNADVSRYSASSAKLALGIDYALLRRAFFSNNTKKENKNIEDVFVCFGGADPENIGIKVQNVLASIKTLETIHVLGKKLENYNPQENTTPIFKYYSGLDEIQMVELMDKCQLAIAPSSTICFELCSRNIPTIAGHFIDNQKDIYEGFKKLGCIIPVGDYNSISDSDLKLKIEKAIIGDELTEIKENQQSIFDGLVQERILKLLEPYA